MRRTVGVLGILGLIGATALSASAQTVQYTLFGQKYNVTKQSRAQTYKNGVTIHLNSDSNTTDLSTQNNYAGLFFSPGPNVAADRLWFAVRTANNDTATGDQLYYLEGSDANGNFTPAVSNAVTFFGGNVNRERGGRNVSVIELNRVDTGVKKDRNVMITAFWDDDCIRMYDLDSMQKDRVSDAIFNILKPSQPPSTGDCTGSDDTQSPNMPRGPEPSFAFLPGTPDGHTVLMASGPGDNGETGLTIWDTTKNDAYPVLTDITAQTMSAAKPFPHDDGSGGNLTNQKIAQVGNTNEYWFLMVSPEPGGSQGGQPRQAIQLVRTQITVPADPSKAKPNDIKVTVLDTQDMLKTAADILFNSKSAGLTGVTIGRPISTAANAPHVVYFADYDGNYYTLTPAP